MGLTRDLMFGDLASELHHTRTLLDAVPDEHFDWKPHDKSWHLGGLAHHVANILTWQKMVLETDGLDLGNMPPPPEPPTSMAEVLENFETNRAAFEETLAGVSDETLNETWTLSMGDHDIMSGPKVVILRQVGVNHTAHHRGQLTVYLRMLDVAVPSTFGPTADDQGGFG